MKKIAIVGASGHGRVIADIAELNGYDDIVFLDDDESVKTCGHYPVVGKTSEGLDRDYIIAIGNARVREKLQALHKDRIVTLIHPAAVIASSAKLGRGSVAMAGAVVNPGAVIGEGCIMNTCSSVDHDCRLGDFVHISVGAHTSGTVIIGDRTWIGAGAIVNNNITICPDCMIGAGAVVVNDITEPGTYIGVPAKGA